MFHSMVPIVCLLSDYLSNSLIVDLDRRSQSAIFTARRKNSLGQNRIGSIIAYSYFFACVIFLRLLRFCALFILRAYFFLRKALRAFEWKPRLSPCPVVLDCA